jgi:hypothetical protein
LNGEIEKQLSDLSRGRWIMVRLEDFREKVPIMLGFLSVAIVDIPVFVSNKATYPVRRWTEWTESEHKTFAGWCGGIMDAHYPGWRK